MCQNSLLDQGYEKIRRIQSLKKFIFPYQDLVEIYSVSAEKIISDGFSYSENVYRNDPDLVQAFLKKCWVESDFNVPKLPLSLWLKVSGCHYNSIYNNT
jgi:hypothetical protein